MQWPTHLLSRSIPISICVWPTGTTHTCKSAQASGSPHISWTSMTPSYCSSALLPNNHSAWTLEEEGERVTSISSPTSSTLSSTSSTRMYRSDLSSVWPQKTTQTISQQISPIFNWFHSCIFPRLLHKLTRQYKSYISGGEEPAEFPGAAMRKVGGEFVWGWRATLFYHLSHACHATRTLAVFTNVFPSKAPSHCTRPQGLGGLHQQVR